MRRLLLRDDILINAMDKAERTAFCMAAEYNNLETLRVLLNDEKVGSGGSLSELRDKGDRYMNTPLHKAAEKGFLQVLRLLLNPERKEVQGSLTLSSAFVSSSHLIFQSAGAKINAKNEEEKTPLHLAAKEGRTRIVRALLKADKQLGLAIYADEDEDSNTPLHIAATQVGQVFGYFVPSV